MKQNTCNSNAMYSGDITDSMMCAADTNEDSCSGDSGGPLFDSDNNAVVGVTSWGNGCARADSPGVYARISDEVRSPRIAFRKEVNIRTKQILTYASMPQNVSCPFSFRGSRGSFVVHMATPNLVFAETVLLLLDHLLLLRQAHLRPVPAHLAV